MGEPAEVVQFPEVVGSEFVPREQAAATDELDVDVAAAELEVVRGDVVEWTPERASALVRAVGFGLHTLDPAASLPDGEELWRATEQEAEEIGVPLARILARYEPARKLAGVVDEVELGAAFVSYAKRNMRQRGRLVLAAKAEAEGDGWSGEAD